MQFITGYLVEKSLSVDNIFVFLMLFTYFAVPAEFQKRALIIGIIGAIVLRAILILVGAWLLAKFHWVSICSAPSWSSPAPKCGLPPARSRTSNQNPVLKWLRGHMKIRTAL